MKEDTLRLKKQPSLLTLKVFLVLLIKRFKD